jgi:drug/metabolite transporter (DMT)-like permease
MDDQLKETVCFNRLLEKSKVIPCAGIFLALVSGTIFATAGFIVKLLPDVNPLEIVVVRSMVQMIAMMPVIMFYNIPVLGVPGERAILFTRALLSSFGFLAYYAAVHMIPLSDAIVIDFSSSAFVYIFACIYLREECGFFQCMTVATTMAGVLMIAKPAFLFGSGSSSGSSILAAGDDDIDPVTRATGTALAVISCLATANAMIMIRKMTKTPTLTNANAYSLASIISGIAAITFMAMVFHGKEVADFSSITIPKTTYEIVLLIANGLCGAAGQMCLVAALKIEEASLVSLARTIDIVMAFVYQIFWLPDEIVHWTSVLGAVIVVSSVSISGLRRWLSDKPGKWTAVWYLINCGIRKERHNNEETIIIIRPGDRKSCS